MSFAGSQALLLAIHQKLLTTQREAEMMVATEAAGGAGGADGRLQARHRVGRGEKGQGRNRRRKEGKRARKGGRDKKRMGQSRSVPALRHPVAMYDTITAATEDVATVSEEEGLGEGGTDDPRLARRSKQQDAGEAISEKEK